MTEEQICELAKDKALDIQKYIIDGNVDIDSFAKDCCLAGAHSRDEEIKQWKESKRKLRLRLMQQIHNLRNPWISVKDRLPECNQEGKSEYCVIHRFDGSLYVAKYLAYRDKWVETDGICNLIGGITHWMQIPKLTKEE